MKLFLTSDMGGIRFTGTDYESCMLNGSNDFVTILKSFWPDSPHILIISSDPEDYEMNDGLCLLYGEALRMTGLPSSGLEVCDNRNQHELNQMQKKADVILLAGGHVPTQNLFFTRLGLAGKLSGYQGIVIGISAGTMNSADMVYAQPELEGEAADSSYQRYLKGLGLTKISILPHFCPDSDSCLDGLRLLEDISLPDSRVRPFYAIPDGSYLFSDGLSSRLYGEAYYFHEGKMEKVCETDHTLELI